MNAVDRTTAVMSIRQKYVRRQQDGSKTIEFRRQPLPKQITTVLIWQTGTDGGIVGRFTVASQSKDRVRAWLTIGDGGLLTARPGAGIEPDLLSEYAGGLNAYVYAIAMADTLWLPRTIPGRELGIDRAPQSWRYAPTGWRAVLS